jgi:hypothetical protein
MQPAEHPWYWSWRGWRASTWLLLYWSAVMWPAIVSTAVSDEFLSGVGAAVGIGVWAVGVGLVALGRFLAGRIRARIGSADGPRGGRPVALLRTALPFAAALVLLYFVAVPLVAAWNAHPSDLEAAVERQWQGRQLTVPLGFGVGGSEPETATAPVSAEDVSCEDTSTAVDGAAVHACTIVHCDVDRASFFDCPDTTSPACAALAGGELVLVSGTWSTGPTHLRDRMPRVPECTF